MTSPEWNVEDGFGLMAEENIHALGQLVDFLDDLEEAHLYGQAFGARSQHSIGKHVRHIIDHYLTFLTAVGEHKVLDYEDRQRDETLETDRQAAHQCLNRIVRSFSDNSIQPSRGAPLAMQHNSGGHYQTVLTSMERELAFLASHTVHHMAIIGMLAEQAGLHVDADFGVNPSTLRHWARKADKYEVKREAVACNN